MGTVAAIWSRTLVQRQCGAGLQLLLLQGTRLCSTSAAAGCAPVQPLGSNEQQLWDFSALLQHSEGGHFSYGPRADHESTAGTGDIGDISRNAPQFPPDEQYGAVAVNHTIPRGVESVWNGARLRVAADGGWERASAAGLSPADFLVGDFDSALESTRNAARALGGKVEHSSCQDSTDLEKALVLLLREAPGVGLSTPPLVAVLGGMGGSFSHVAANINALCRFPSIRGILLGSRNAAVLLRKGRARLLVPPGLHCSIVPLHAAPGTPLCATSSGLRWPLDGVELSFGAVVSTSNCCEGPVVELELSQDALFIADLIH